MAQAKLFSEGGENNVEGKFGNNVTPDDKLEEKNSEVETSIEIVGCSTVPLLQLQKSATIINQHKTIFQRTSKPKGKLDEERTAYVARLPHNVAHYFYVFKSIGQHSFLKLG